MLQQVRGKVFRLGRFAGFEHDAGQWPFAPLGVGDGDHGRFGHVGVGHQGVFQIDRTDPLAAGLDQVFGAVGDAHKTHRVHAGHIARAQPAVGAELVFAHRHLVVTAGDEGATHLNFANMLTVPRGIESVFAPDAQLRQRHGHARHSGAAVTLVERCVFQL